MYLERDTDARFCNHCHNGKAVIITYSECVCITLFIQHAVPMPSFIFSSVTCPNVPYFYTLFHSFTVFENMNLLIMRSVLCNGITLISSCYTFLTDSQGTHYYKEYALGT